jgi:hypothetical protein
VIGWLKDIVVRGAKSENQRGEERKVRKVEGVEIKNYKTFVPIVRFGKTINY